MGDPMDGEELEPLKAPDEEHKRGTERVDRVAVAEKQKHALELRIAGASYPLIAEKLGYSNHSGAYKAVSSALKETLREPAEAVRKLELERLDRLMMASWVDAVDGADGAFSRVMRVMERRAKMLGLDAPARVDTRTVPPPPQPIETPEDIEIAETEIEEWDQQQPPDPDEPTGSPSSDGNAP